MTEDHDQPESVPTVQPIWSRGRIASFNYLPYVGLQFVCIPFGWRLVTHPVCGATYLPLTEPHYNYGPLAVLSSARDQIDGFRFATPAEIERAKERARA